MRSKLAQRGWLVMHWPAEYGGTDASAMTQVIFNEEMIYHRAPGTFAEYSNIGVTLMGYLVEVLSGQSFDAFCQDNIFEPLGLTDTAWFLSGVDVSRLASPHAYVEALYLDVMLATFLADWNEPLKAIDQDRSTISTVAVSVICSLR